MIHFLSKNYEKITLLFSVIVFSVLFLVSSPSDDFNYTAGESSIRSGFEYIVNDGKITLIFDFDVSMMPGDKIFVRNSDEGYERKCEVVQICLKRKSSLEITQRNGKKIKGRLQSNGDVFLTQNWSSIKKSLSLSTTEGSRNVFYDDIISIDGIHSYELEEGSNEIDWDLIEYSFYEPISDLSLDENASKRKKWLVTALDENQTEMDLFTPPVVYLVDGKLTSVLPTKEIAKEKEAFGLRLTDFQKDAYRHRLVSWIGNTPYFEDTNFPSPANPEKFVRNRLEVGIPYKQNSKYKPGMPSLVPTTEEDDEKVIKITYFVVQEWTDPKTKGSKRVGRAMIKDYFLDIKPFEINSLMEEVYAGNYKLKLQGELEKHGIQTFEILENETGVVINYGNRTFRILEIDTEAKTVLVDKDGPSPEFSERRKLELP